MTYLAIMCNNHRKYRYEFDLQPGALLILAPYFQKKCTRYNIS